MGNNAQVTEICGNMEGPYAIIVACRPDLRTSAPQVLRNGDVAALCGGMKRLHAVMRRRTRLRLQASQELRHNS